MKNLASTVLGTALIIVSSAPRSLAADGCRFAEERAATVNADGLTDLRVIARAGSLEIEGRDGISEVQVRARACASSEELLRSIELIAEQRGGEVYVEANLPQGGVFRNGQSSLDLVLTVPVAMELDVQDGSGGTRIRNVASLEMEDGSGEIEIENIGGNVDIDDGSGEIEIHRVAGTVRIQDGSGEVIAEDVDGDVVVRDGSGEIVVRRVKGDFTVPSDGSGEIEMEDVQGRVTIPRDS